MTELNYTPLSDGFKIAKDDNGNIVFARNATTLFIASPDDLHAALTPLIGSIGSSDASGSGDVLTAANAQITQLQAQLAAAASAAASVDEQMTALRAQIAADKAAAQAITAGVAPVVADAAPSSTEPAPVIAPSNTGIAGS
ncbi:hypothetical protein [Paraburkholderia fungorum]|uniref:hypothetical protein n=1 Tax=Paraburkholderia fungorum TaxID=134537 RepID=UPI001C1EE4F4|nr:hypothetical protein [Paraburkholderia fungorum]MBU7436510.1 hypothetical protein [Paraburkholderia fungorum]